MSKICKKFALIVIVIALILSASSTSFAENITNCNYPKTGLVVNEDNLANINEYIINDMQTYAVLPTSVDNTDQFPTPGNQGNQNSCTAWAIGYALKSQQEVAKRNWTVNTSAHNFSPAYIFNSMKKGSNTGTDIIDTLKFIYDYGVCPLSYFPYNDSDCSTQPTDIQTAAASLYRITDYNGVLGLTNIKTRIANGEGVVIGISLYPDFVNINNANPIYDDISGEYVGAHTICLIGYDDNMGESGAFKFINSWGTNTQLNGYGWISYDLVLNKAINVYGAGVGFVITVNATDDYVMGDVNNDGEITAADSRLVLRFSASLETPTPTQYVLADVNGDASITAADSQAILQYSSNIITQLPLYD